VGRILFPDITLSISHQLGYPGFLVIPRKAHQFALRIGVTMPEAAIYENSFAPPWDEMVCTPWKIATIKSASVT